MNEPTKMLIAGLLGVILHELFKIIQLKKRAKDYSVPFNVIDHFKEDGWSTLVSVVVVFAAVFGIDEILNIKPEIQKYIKLFFIAVGYMGAELAYMILNVTEKKMLRIVNEKTNQLEEFKTSQNENNTDSIGGSSAASSAAS